MTSLARHGSTPMYRASSMKQIKIAFTHNALNSRGGAERKLLLIAQHLRRLQGVEVAIFVNEYTPEKTFSEYLAGLNIIEVRPRGLVSKFFTFFKIGYLTKDFHLIHAHNHPAHIPAAISKLIRRKPILWFDNEPLLYLEGTRDRERGIRRIKLWLTMLFERIVLPWIDLIVANSRNTQSTIRKFLNRESELIYSGVNTDQLRPALRMRRSKIQISTVSRFEKAKNIDFILRMAAALNQYDFFIAGNGSEETQMRNIIRERNLTNVTLLVAISEKKKIELLQESDIFVFPTLNEPLGINVVEAMSCGTPVVAFNSGGARETVVNNETGFLVDTEQEFMKKVVALAENPALRITMGRASRSRAVSLFSLEGMIDKTLRCYDRLLEQYGYEFRFIGTHRKL